MPYESANALEIDKKLREDFRRRIKDYGLSDETVDPLLVVLFRTFAQQLETLYHETGRIRLSLLDELIAGLGVERRFARPAQTLVRFSSSNPQLIEAGTELTGEADTGERLSFCTDTTIAISGARIALAASYQNGALRLLAGLDMPEEFQAARPSPEPVAANLGPNPCLFLAVQDLPASHLELHSCAFELGPDALRLQRVLEQESWCLAGADGELASRGVLRPSLCNAGIRSLDWLVPSAESNDSGGERPLASAASSVPLPPGFYESKTFVFPKIPADRRFLCQYPRGLEQPLARIFGREARTLFALKRAWLRVSFPKEIPALHLNIASVALHCTTASNVQSVNETIYFDRHGTSIPISREAGAPAYLVAPLSIVGESGVDYLPEFSASSDPFPGRYSIQNGRLDLRPGRRIDSTVEASATVRLWTTAGSAGNRVGAGRVRHFRDAGRYPGITLANPTAAAGGTDGEGQELAQARFAKALLSRDRIVTREDMHAAVKAFDRRITKTQIALRLSRTDSGLRRTEQIAIELDRSDFVDPEIEGRMLAEDLSRFLQSRSLDGSHVAVRVELSR